MLTGDWHRLGACQLLWEHGCLKVPWNSFSAPSMSPGAPQCQLQRRLLSPTACPGWPRAEELGGYWWGARSQVAEVPCSAVKRRQTIYFLPVGNLSDAAASGLLLELLNHPDSQDLPRCQNTCWGKSQQYIWCSVSFGYSLSREAEYEFTSRLPRHPTASGFLVC